MNATGLHIFVYIPLASNEKCYYFIKDHQFKKLILNKVIIESSATVQWHMAEEILIAVIFVEFQRQVGQLALQNSGHSVGKWKGGLSAGYSFRIVTLKKWDT